MKFSYYRNLTSRQRRIYDRSDGAGSIAVPGGRDLGPLVREIAAGLRQDDRARTENAVQRLVSAVLGRLHVQAVCTRVLAVRPTNHREELHGLYEFGGRRPQPVISVWMRTAQRRQTVAFRSFMRTLLHEVIHHLDYQLLRLEDSYHTQGFYKRAESLYRQLVPAELCAMSGSSHTSARRADPASQPALARGADTEEPRRRRTPAPHRPPAPAPTGERPRRGARATGSPRTSPENEPAEEQLLLPF